MTSAPGTRSHRVRWHRWAGISLLSTVLIAAVACSSPMSPAETTTTTWRGGPYAPTPESLAAHPIPAWWDDGKFGIFIHWGPYAVPAFGWQIPFVGRTAPSEWYLLAQQIPLTPPWWSHASRYGTDVTYDELFPRFTAERFDAQDWVDLFESAGARYFVLTAKHHDGFAMWCSDTTERDSCDDGPHRDLVGELMQAARTDGRRIKPGLYYSIPEFENPAPKPSRLFGSDEVSNLVFGTLQPRNAYTGEPVAYRGQGTVEDYADGIVRPQVRELIDRYGPQVLWCDYGTAEWYFRSNELIAQYFNRAVATASDGVVVNDRCGDSTTRRDYQTVEQGAGFEQEASGLRSETARTMGESWGFDQNEPVSARRSSDDLIDGLASAVAANSNFLLNIGPTADGSIPTWQRERLLDIGAWLRINGAAIYGSRPWSTAAWGDVRFTLGADGSVYAIMLTWPGSGLRLPASLGLRGPVELLGSGAGSLPVRVDGDMTVVGLPAATAADATVGRSAYVLRFRPR